MWQKKVINSPKYNINVFHCNPDEVELHALKKSNFDNRYNIAYWVWELPDFPNKWVKLFKYFDEIWTPSYFSAESMFQKTIIPVIRVPHSIEVECDKKYDRKHFKLPEDKFLFVFMNITFR